MEKATDKNSKSKSKYGLLLIMLILGASATFFIYSRYIVIKKVAGKVNGGAVLVDTVQPGLKSDIAILNGNTAFPFDTGFIKGYANVEALLTGYLKKTDAGFEISLESESFLTTPVIQDSFMYMSGGFCSKSYYLFNANTGKEIWGRKISDDGPSSAVLLDSLVIFNTESCTIFALDRFTGKCKWSKWLGDPLLTHPVTDGQSVYTAYPGMRFDTGKPKGMNVLIPSHVIISLDSKTGAVNWQRWLDGDIMTTPVLDHDEIYLSTFSGTLYKIDKRDGKILHAATVKATSIPVVYGDKIYTTQRQQSGLNIEEAIIEIDKNDLKVRRIFTAHAAPYLDYRQQQNSLQKKMGDYFDESNGFLSVPDACGWKKAKDIVGLSNVSTLQNFLGSTIVVDNGILYSCFGNCIISVDATTGKTLWAYPILEDLHIEGGHAATMPIVFDKIVITVTINGDILMLDKRSGELVKRIQLHTDVRNQPVVANGKIFIPTVGGRLIAINTGSVHLTPWPMFLKNNAHNCSINY